MSMLSILGFLSLYVDFPVFKYYWPLLSKCLFRSFFYNYHDKINSRGYALAQSCAVRLKRDPTDRWPSGRRRTPGKCVGGRPSPGFESLSVRQPPLLLICIQYSSVA